MKQPISTAPENLRRIANRQRYGSRSIPEGYLSYLAYCKTAHFMPEQYSAIYTPLAEALKASGDAESYRLYCVAHAEELRVERECDARYRALTDSGWVNGPSFEEVVAKNQAAAAADRLEAELQQRAGQVMLEREAATRSEAWAQARVEAARRAQASEQARQLAAERKAAERADAERQAAEQYEYHRRLLRDGPALEQRARQLKQEAAERSKAGQ